MAKRSVLDVLYEDDTEASLQIRPFAIVAAERHFKGEMPQAEGTLWAAWYGITGDKLSFDEWTKTLAAVDERKIDTKKVAGDGAPLAPASDPSSSDLPVAPE